jgi:ribonuclease HI
VHKWKSNGWKKADGKPVLNEGLVRYLHALLDERAVSGQFVSRLLLPFTLFTCVDPT